MSNIPCVCPKDHQGRIVRTNPRCFDHATWDRHPSEYTVVLAMPSRPAGYAVLCMSKAECLVQ